MSTILEAQRELERRRAGQSGPPPPVPTAPADRPRWALVAAASACVVVGVSLLVVALRKPSTAPAERPAPPAVAGPDRRVGAVDAPGDLPKRTDPAAEATPWGRVEKPPAAPPVAVPPSAANRAAPGAADRRAEAPPAPRRTAAVAAASKQESDAGAAGVRLKAIHFDKVASERTVTLVLDGGRELTLRQGERAAGVEVQLILPTVAYVHQGTSVFAVNLNH